MAVKKFRRFAIVCLFLLVVCALMPVNTSAQGGNYSFMNIDYPGAYLTFPTAVNDSGAIVGYYLQTTRPLPRFPLLRWRVHHH